MDPKGIADFFRDFVILVSGIALVIGGAIGFVLSRVLR